MRRVLNSVTALLFFLHVVPECGAHHGHTSEAIAPAIGCCPASTQSSSSAPCGHQHGSSHASCQASHCLFIRNKTRCESATEAVRLERKSVPRTDASFARFEHAIPSPNPHNVRLHLLLQVLLV